MYSKCLWITYSNTIKEGLYVKFWGGILRNPAPLLRLEPFTFLNSIFILGHEK